MDRRELGRQGEAAARRFLEKKKYKILAQNYRRRSGEIDLIAEKKGAITFVEVKCRSSLEFGFPQESVIKRKQERIMKVATIFLKEMNLWSKVDCHFDVLSIYQDGRAMHLEHIKDAFWK